MGIPIEVPGLDSIIPDLGEGRLVVAESGADPAKSFFVRRLCSTAARRDLPVSFITSRGRDEVLNLFSEEGRLPPWTEQQLDVVESDGLDELDGHGSRGGLLAIDSFSFLTLDLPPPRLSKLLRALRELGRRKGTAVILATDRGMTDPRSEAIVVHLVDGVIQFHAREAPEGLVRFLRIPKWTEGRFVDRNIYYQFDGKRIAVDLRSRVL